MTSKRAVKIMMTCGVDRNLANHMLSLRGQKKRYMENRNVAVGTVTKLIEKAGEKGIDITGRITFHLRGKDSIWYTRGRRHAE